MQGSKEFDSVVIGTILDARKSTGCIVQTVEYNLPIPNLALKQRQPFEI